MRVSRPTLPREIAGGIWWLGSCNASDIYSRGLVHVHVSFFLIVGETKSLLVDTGATVAWPTIEGELEQILGGRQIDFIMPTHPEIAHAGNLHRLLRKYQGAQVIGDIRDYHLYYPAFENRLVPAEPGDRFDLGGGYRFTILEAIIKDAPNTQWGYESNRQVLFVADAFCYSHIPPADEFPDEPIHLPGECALLTSELDAPPSVDHAAFVTKASLFWTHFVNIDPYLKRVDDLLLRYPAKIIAPAHGSVITDLSFVMPVIKEAHRLAYQG